MQSSTQAIDYKISQIIAPFDGLSLTHSSYLSLLRCQSVRGWGPRYRVGRARSAREIFCSLLQEQADTEKGGGSERYERGAPENGVLERYKRGQFAVRVCSARRTGQTDAQTTAFSDARRDSTGAAAPRFQAYRYVWKK